MQLPTLALFAAASSAFVLKAVSDDKDINGQTLLSVHEGAGIEYLFLGTGEGQDFTYDQSKQSLSFDRHDFTFNVGQLIDNYLSAGQSVEPWKVHFDNKGYFNSENKYYACKNTGDPYQLSEKSYFVLYNKQKGDCKEIKIQKGDAAAASSSAGPAPSSSAAGGHQWNQTVTDQVTVTGYTTYCPESTTLTVTTCSNKACAPHTVTVSEPSTVVITEPCVVPSTAAPAPSSTKASHSSVAAESTPAAVSSYEAGAAKNAAGIVAGVAGVAALLI